MSAQLTLIDTPASAPIVASVPSVGCLANLDDVLATMAPAQPGAVVAYWENNHADIIIDGIFNSRGTWGARGIRWHCPAYQNKGMFGRGIALYGDRLPEWANTLPNVK